MSEIDQAFQQACEDVKYLKNKPDDTILLDLYAFYKQGSVGDVSGDKPNMFNFVAAGKYSAWEKLKGMKQDEAKQLYVDLVERLKSA